MSSLLFKTHTYIRIDIGRLCSCLPTYHLLPTYVKTLPSSRHGNDYIFCNFQADKKIWCATLQRATTVSTYITYIPVLLKQWKNQELQIPIWICTYLAWEHHKVGKIRVTTRKSTMHHVAFLIFFCLIENETWCWWPDICAILPVPRILVLPRNMQLLNYCRTCFWLCAWAHQIKYKIEKLLQM